MLPAPATNSHAESAAHEADALSVRGILWFVISFVAATLIVLLIVWKMYVSLENESVSRDVTNSALATEQRFPPEPRLQPSLGHEQLPEQDLAGLTKREDKEFARRGWLDDKTGKFEIPQEIVSKVAQLSAPRGGEK